MANDVYWGVGTFFHDIGGDVDDYVVDLQFKDTEHPWTGLGVHQRYYGGDESGGAWWQELTAQYISVGRVSGDTIAGRFRIRIWVIPDADFDSGWTPLSLLDRRGETISLDHNLGGNPDDYVVYLELKDEETGGIGIHHLDYGGDEVEFGGTTIVQGSLWTWLSSAFILVQRNEFDYFTDRVRVRIWRKPDPDWDSGWVDMATAVWNLEHSLGGPWNDYVVDLQFMGGPGVRSHGKYGGDSWLDGSDNRVYEGTCWSNLTSSHVTLTRIGPMAEPYIARVRIWASRRPKYDSGWIPVSQPGGHQFEHNLRGDIDAYFTDLTFRDTAGPAGHGVNKWGYGGDAWYDVGSSEVLARGGFWTSLTSTVVQAFRNSDDVGADEMRVRMWIPPQPDYDSGWTLLGDPPDDRTFNFPFVDSADDLVVDLQTKSSGCGVTHQWHGLDQWHDGSQVFSMGAAWKQLTDHSVVVQRASSGNCTDEARIRTWSDTTFGYDSGWVPIWGCNSFNFSLGESVSNFVVDLEMQDSGTLGLHNVRIGGDTVFGGGLQYHGAHWERLGENEVWVCKGANDTNVDLIRVRALNTNIRPGVFSDGFESGDSSLWSAVVP